MREIGRLNINQMMCLIALKENNFNSTNTAIDLNVAIHFVCKTMGRIEEYVGFDVFIRGKKKGYVNRDGILDFSNKGLELYFSIKTFLDSIMLIGKDDENIKY